MTELPPAGWYDDPEQPATRRYWDGTAWTDQRSPSGATPAAGPRSTGDGPPAGWYRDPEQAQTQRYWDGASWTDQRAPAAPVSQKPPTEAFFGIGAAVLLGIGSIGPWVETGLFSVGGMDGDGVITLGAALVGGLVCVIAAQNRTASLTGFGAVTVLVGLAAAATAIYDLANILGSETELFGQTVRVGNPGWGLWLAAASAVALTVIGFALAMVKRPPATA